MHAHPTRPGIIPAMVIGFKLDVDERGSTRVVRLEGECDMATAPQLQETLQQFRPPAVDQVILDLSDLTFLDSSGIGVIVAALKRLREADGELKIAGASGPVLRVLEITGLDGIIPLHPDVPSAS